MPLPASTVSCFSRGFKYPFRAGRYLLRNRKALTGYVVVPFLINTAVFSMLLLLAFTFFGQLVDRYLPQGDAWYLAVLHGLIWLAAFVIMAVFMFFSFTVLGNLIASPFNDLLSEKTELLVRGDQGSSPFVLGRFLRESLGVLIEEAKKMSLFIAAMLLLLLVNLVPLVGLSLYSLLSVCLTILFLVIEYSGYYFSRHLVSFRDQRRFIVKNAALCAGFGSGLFLLLAIPFLQLLAIPLGVVGGTLLCLDVERANPDRHRI